MTVKGNVVGGAMMAPTGKLTPVIADKGDPGAQGMSAYQVWLAAGNTGTETQYQASLKGAPSTVPGPEGNDGWTPVLAGEADGTRTLIKVVDWTGGEGTKPATGMYIGTTGYVATKVLAFNFNAAKRVKVFSGITNASGIATIDYTSMGFTAVPQVVALPATTTALSGPTRTTVITTPTTDAPTATTAKLKVETQAILTGLVTLLVGATANALVIEA